MNARRYRPQTCRLRYVYNLKADVSKLGLYIFIGAHSQPVSATISPLTLGCRAVKKAIRGLSTVLFGVFCAIHIHNALVQLLLNYTWIFGTIGGYICPPCNVTGDKAMITMTNVMNYCCIIISSTLAQANSRW